LPKPPKPAELPKRLGALPAAAPSLDAPAAPASAGLSAAATAAAAAGCLAGSDSFGSKAQQHDNKIQQFNKL
jgi:hypothetical protein